MSRSFTPGLKVNEATVVRRRRILPIKGTVTASVGDAVGPEVVVARTELPGDVYPVNVANALGLSAAEAAKAMLVPVGAVVAAGDVIAEARSFFGLFKSEVRTPKGGTIESVSPVTGMVIVRGAPHPVTVSAYVRGRVVEVHDGEGVTVETRGTFVQGIFGVGGETVGPLTVLARTPDEVLDAPAIRPEHKGAIVVGGSLVTSAAVARAREVGVRGIVAGGIDDEDLRALLGRDLGVAITGQEPIGITIIVTEGFGRIPTAQTTFALLKAREGREASINGATQIRAGVIRPEIVIPLDHVETKALFAGADDETRPGDTLRCIRRPYFGRIGTVASIPEKPVTMPSGAVVRVFEIAFDDGERVVVPRANVERIEARSRAAGG